MDTRSRRTGDWINEVRRGIVRLPRFQREEVWTPNHIENFLWAILKERPLGVFLVLEVDSSNQPFETRPLADAQNNGERCREHLLDGQQRLVALWRSFNDNHESHSFYVTFDKAADGLEETGVLAVSKRGRDKNKIGNAVEEFRKGWIPIRILSPGEPGSKQATAWRTCTSTASPTDEEAISVIIDRLRSAISGTVIPYLSLPLDTPPEDAIDIFIETNRSSVRLSPYDLAVAQMEVNTSESLTEKIEELVQAVPAVNDLESNVGELVLKVQCLLEGKKPTYGNYAEIDFQKLNDDWQKITAGMKWMTETLGDLNIWTSQRLPTAVPLRVLPPLHGFIPRSGTGYANAMRLVKKYLWRSFLTTRYERQANDRLKEDFDALVEVLQRKRSESDIPAFQHDKPSGDDIKNAGWPTAGGILSRAILVVCSLQGANDIASNRPLRKWKKVDHHHIFPRAVLKEINKEPRHRFTDFKPFHGVVLLEAGAGEIHRIVRKAEGPLHNSLTRKWLSHDEKQKLEAAMEVVFSGIKERVPKYENEQFQITDVLPITSYGFSSGGRRPGLVGQFREVRKPPRFPNVSDTEDTEVGPGASNRENNGNRKGVNNNRRGRGTFRRSGNAIRFAALPVPMGKRSYRIDLTPAEKTSRSEVRFALDESLDESCDRFGSETFVELKAVKIDGRPAPETILTCDEEDRVLGIRLGVIHPEKTLRIEFDYELPKDIDTVDDMPVVLKTQLIRRAANAEKQGTS